MSNLSINAATPAAQGESTNTLLTGNGVSDDSSVKGTSRRSFAEVISAHMISASILSEDQQPGLPVGIMDLSDRGVDMSKAVKAIDAASAPIVASQDDDATVPPETAPDDDMSPDTIGLLASMMHSVTAAQPVVAEPRGVTSAREVTGKTKTLPTHQARTAAEVVRPGKPVADAAHGVRTEHPAESTNSGTTRSAPVADSPAPRNMPASQRADSTGPRQQPLKPTVSDTRAASTREQQTAAPASQFSRERLVNADSMEAQVTAPPPQVMSQTSMRAADSFRGSEGSDGSQNIPDVSRTIDPPRNPAAEMITPGTHRADAGRAPIALNIATPLVSREWPAEFSQKIVWMGDNKHQVAELHLNPPDLGPLDVVLKVSGNHATVQFSSPHSAVRDVVENAIPRLREMLAENGVTLGNTSVSDQAPQFRSTDGSANQSFSGNTRQDDSSLTATTPDSTASSVPTPTSRRHDGLVDTFA